MRSFTPDYLNRGMVISQTIMRLVGQIYEYKGKQTLFAERKPEVLESLRQIAFIESVESSNRLERIQTSRQILKQLILKGEQPQNRSQEELAGYRDVLDGIHQHHESMPHTIPVVLQLHRDLLKLTPTPGGIFKMGPNDIVEKNAQGRIINTRLHTVSPHLTPLAMEDLHVGFQSALTECDPLILIPNYVHDFLCIHPFSDGNGRMARLLTVLLLYRHGFKVARYISIEKLIEDTKISYYESLSRSDIGWSEGKHDHRFFTEYLLGVVLAAYRQLEANIEKLETGRGYKTSLVMQAIAALSDQFSIRDVEECCPSVSRDTVRNVLNKLSREGKVINYTKGRNARWKKVV